mmetsp:Transcript_23175/g.36964  ORF Transcript_23175/g.36964 Transcript_23175/m.36964 type:complete len:107 (+) Transcript_23175:202-522(+)
MSHGGRHLRDASRVRGLCRSAPPRPLCVPLPDCACPDTVPAPAAVAWAERGLWCCPGPSAAPPCDGRRCLGPRTAMTPPSTWGVSMGWGALSTAVERAVAGPFARL